MGVKLSTDKKALISAARDGTIRVNKIDFGGLQVSYTNSDVEYNYPEIVGKLALEEIGEDAEDIIDDKIYSIQQAKLLAERDARQTLAEKIKQKLKNQVKSV